VRAYIRVRVRVRVSVSACALQDWSDCLSVHRELLCIDSYNVIPSSRIITTHIFSMLMCVVLVTQFLCIQIFCSFLFFVFFGGVTNVCEVCWLFSSNSGVDLATADRTILLFFRVIFS
jgi:hypothetical protein